MAHLCFSVEGLRVHVRSFGNYSKCLIKFIQISILIVYTCLVVIRIIMSEFLFSLKNIHILKHFKSTKNLKFLDVLLNTFAILHKA